MAVPAALISLLFLARPTASSCRNAAFPHDIVFLPSARDAHSKPSDPRPDAASLAEW
jgi:hypothetical protein